MSCGRRGEEISNWRSDKHKCPTHLLDVLVEQEDRVIEAIPVHALRVQRERPRSPHHADQVDHGTPAPQALNGVVQWDTKIRC